MYFLFRVQVGLIGQVRATISEGSRRFGGSQFVAVHCIFLGMNVNVFGMCWLNHEMMCWFTGSRLITHNDILTKDSAKLALSC